MDVASDHNKHNVSLLYQQKSHALNQHVQSNWLKA